MRTPGIHGVCHDVPRLAPVRAVVRRRHSGQYLHRDGDMTTRPEMESDVGEGLPLALLDLQSRILSVVDTAILAVDLNSTIIYANPYASTLYGYAPHELLGAPARSLMARTLTPELEDEIARAIAHGESWEGTFEVRRKDGTVVTVRGVDSPLSDSQGGLVGIISAGIDVSQELFVAQQKEREAQVSQFLADSGTAMAESVDYVEALTALGRSCASFLGDLCLIDVVENGEVRRMVAQHADASAQPLVDELVTYYAPDPAGVHPAIQALRTGQTSVSAYMSDDFLRATTRDERHYQIVKELGFTSFLCVPLMARERTLGALTIVSCERSRRFTDDDVMLTQEVAWRASLLIDNARLLSESSHVARVLQASLMPPSLPVIPGLEVAARYVAFGSGLEVGGDFYDLFSAGRGAWVFALGDVCGRGPEAAVVTGLIRHALRSAALEVRQPGRLLGLVNEVLLSDAADSHLYSTLLCGFLRPNASSVRLALANGGHPPPIVVRAPGTVEVPHNRDTVIGAFNDLSWSSRQLTLNVGDILVAYTDGITESRRDGELFGERRIAQVVLETSAQSIEDIADAIIDAVREFAGHEPMDDLALMAMRVVDAS
jgi:PAS domain S-box-containing protein